MAILTSERRPVRPRLMGVQLEVHCIVIELSRGPINNGVTGGAVRAELTGMSVIFFMAGETICGCVLEVGIFMARLARNIRMTAFELEGKLRVIDRAVPTLGSMAGGTVSAELARVFIILGVTGETIGRDALVFIINVTELTLNGVVFSDQFETGKIVIELGRLAPSFCSVTDSTLRSELTLMLVVFLMAVVTLLRGSLQV